MLPFNPLDSSTWLPTLTVEQVAAIYQRSVGGIRKACQKHHKHPFHPAPFKVQPFRWRKVDVLRDLEGGRAMLRRAG